MNKSDVMTFREFVRSRNSWGLRAKFIDWVTMKETFPNEIITWKDVKFYLIEQRKDSEFIKIGHQLWRYYCGYMNKNGVSMITEQQRPRIKPLKNNGNMSNRKPKQFVFSEQELKDATQEYQAWEQAWIEEKKLRDSIRERYRKVQRIVSIEERETNLWAND